MSQEEVTAKREKRYQIRRAHYIRNREKELFEAAARYKAEPDKQKKYKREWYERNRLAMIPAAKARREKTREFINVHKSGPCTDCGNCFPSCAMDFDHVRGVKYRDIGKMLNHTNTALVFAEIEKCEVVCANCHRVRTFNRQQEKKKERDAA